MRNRSPHRLRPVTYAAALAGSVALVIGPAGAAFAETPASWDDPESMSTLHILALYGGIPLVLFIAIAIFGWLTHTSKATTYPIRREQDQGVALASGVEQDQQALPES